MPAISSKSNASASGCLTFFFSIFAIVGVVALVSLIILPAVRVARATNWVATPCTIVTSSIVSNGSGKDSSYYPDIAYTYQYDGGSYQSSAINFLNSSTKSSSTALVRTFPVGKTVQCFVNPADPTQAVLQRDYIFDWLFLLPLVFLAIGVGGMTWSIKSTLDAKRNITRGHSDWEPKSVSDRDKSTQSLAGEIELKPKNTPLGNCIGLLLFALIWNGMIGFFFFKVFLQGREAGFMRILMGLFLIPFALIGLLIIAGAISSFLSLFTARIRMIMSRASASPGETFELKWQTSGGMFGPRTLQVILQAREEAIYQRGTDTITERSIFHEEEIFNGQAVSGAGLGWQSVAIPAGTMHSFAAAHNKVIWTLRVKGKIPYWPDITDEYVILVTPQTQATGGGA